MNGRVCARKSEVHRFKQASSEARMSVGLRGSHRSRQKIYKSRALRALMCDMDGRRALDCPRSRTGDPPIEQKDTRALTPSPVAEGPPSRLCGYFEVTLGLAWEDRARKLSGRATSRIDFDARQSFSVLRSLVLHSNLRSLPAEALSAAGGARLLNGLFLWLAKCPISVVVEASEIKCAQSDLP